MKIFYFTELMHTTCCKCMLGSKVWLTVAANATFEFNTSVTTPNIYETMHRINLIYMYFKLKLVISIRKMVHIWTNIFRMLAVSM